MEILQIKMFQRRITGNAKPSVLPEFEASGIPNMLFGKLFFLQ
jgi:hypothetical protein